MSANLANAEGAVQQAAVPEPPQRSLWRLAWRRLLGNKAAVFGLCIVLIYLLAAVFGPHLVPYGYADQNLLQINQGPSAAHWLGTDGLGRDFLTRIVWGARTAFLVLPSPPSR